MPDLIVSVSHRLSQDEALRRIQAAVSQAKTQFSDKINDLREGWNGYVGAFQISAQNQQASILRSENPCHCLQSRREILVGSSTH